MEVVRLYGPNVLVPPEAAVAVSVDTIVRDFFLLALESPMFFEALITATEVCCIRVQRKLTREVMYHHGNVLTQLRDKLASQTECATDLVILTILAILGIDVRFSNEHQPCITKSEADVRIS